MEYPNHAPGMDLSPAEHMHEPSGGYHDSHTPVTDHADAGSRRSGAGSGCTGTEFPCGQGSWGLLHYPLAMVYAPCQYFGGLYDLDTAMERGTLFSALDLPLEGGHATGCTQSRTKGRGCSC